MPSAPRHVYLPARQCTDDARPRSRRSILANRLTLQHDWYCSLLWRKLVGRGNSRSVKRLTVYSARWPVGVLLCVILKQSSLRLVASLLILLIWHHNHLNHHFPLSTALTFGNAPLNLCSSSFVGTRPRKRSMSSENFRARAALAMMPRPNRARVRGARELYDLQQRSQ